MPSSDRHRSGYSRYARRRSPRRRRRALIATASFVLLVLALGLGAWWVATSTPEDAPKVAQAAPAAIAASRPASSDTERTAALAPLTLPADEAPHGAGMEWWYYNGLLDAAAGQRYAFHVAVFVAGGLVRHTVMHASLVDLRSGRRYVGQYKTAGMASASVPGGFDFRRGDWRFASAAQGTAHTVQFSLEGGASLALDLRDDGPLVAHRAAGSATPGLLDFGASGISYYYSRPRLAAQGVVTMGEATRPVKGTVWFDHQWGDFDVSDLGWNWFALHLTDGSQLMLYQLFDRQGRPVTTAGTHTRADGQSSPLDGASLQLRPTRYWTSPATRITYPVAWRLQLPAGPLDIVPFASDAEFDAGRTSLNVYWEGAVKASGAPGGEGFMELSGYERLKPPPAAAGS